MSYKTQIIDDVFILKNNLSVQEYSDTSDNFIITGKFRIDNIKELKKIIEYTDTLEINDEDLLIALYQKLGDNFLQYLVGDFSFVIWDKQRETLFCARDRMGLYRFFYFYDNEKYVFSPEISSLLNLFPENRKPNINSMKSFYLNRGTINLENTMYDSIYSLPPSCTLSYKKGKVKIDRYWFPELIKIDDNITLESAKKKFQDIFRESITCRLKSNTPVGVELSGGLDSSSITCIASQLDNKQKLYAMSLRYGENKYDESEYIDAVLEQTKIDNFSFDSTQIDYKNEDILKFMYSTDSSWPWYLTGIDGLYLLDKAKNKNIQIVLTGLGGDEITAGTFYVFADYFIKLHWITLIRELYVLKFDKSIIKRYLILPLLSKKQKHRLVKIKSFLTLKRIKNKYNSTIHSAPLFDRKKCQYIAQEAEISAVLSRHFSSWVDNNPTHSAKYFGIEMRHPFYDKRLVEFALSLPIKFKYSQGHFKIILKEAMEGILPENIRKRNDKATFNQLIMDAINGIDLEEFWQESYISDLEIVRKSEIFDLVRKYNDDNRKFSNELWCLINLEYWYRINFTEEVTCNDSV